jgi:hypothetical protein
MSELYLHSKRLHTPIIRAQWIDHLGRADFVAAIGIFSAIAAARVRPKTVLRRIALAYLTNYRPKMINSSNTNSGYDRHLKAHLHAHSFLLEYKTAYVNVYSVACSTTSKDSGRQMCHIGPDPTTASA